MELNPWHPMQGQRDLACLGKLLEELGEATAAASRCLIQGIGESEPVTGKSNRLWLEEEEIADVLACVAIVKVSFSLDEPAITQRSLRKIEHIAAWINMIDQE